MNRQETHFAIINWMYWLWNFNDTGDFIQGAFGNEGEMMVKHLRSKFESAYESFGTYGCIPAFFGELDSRHREKLIDFVCDNYNYKR